MTELNGYINRQEYITDICNKIEYKEKLSESEENFIFSSIGNLKHLLRYEIDKETQLNIKRHIAVFETYIYSDSDTFDKYIRYINSENDNEAKNNINEQSIDLSKHMESSDEMPEETNYISEQIVSDIDKITVAYFKRTLPPNLICWVMLIIFTIFIFVIKLRPLGFFLLGVLVLMFISTGLDLRYIRNLHFRKVIDELKLHGLINEEVQDAIKEIEEDNAKRKREMTQKLVDKRIREEAFRTSNINLMLDPLYCDRSSIAGLFDDEELDLHDTEDIKIICK